MGAGLVKQSGGLRADEYRREYQLVAHPDAATCFKIINEKQRFFLKYGIEEAVPSTPSIIIARFEAPEVMEETILRWIHRICNLHTSFPVSLNNYSGIPSDTIFLRIENPQPFQHLSRQLRPVDELVRSSSCPPVRFAQRPYLSIAGNLSESVYQEAMPFYSRKTFHACFQVNELMLLMRDHSFDCFKTVTVFRFVPVNLKSYTAMA